VTVSLRTRADDGSLVVDVIDTGPGIAADARARVFDAFFSTKPRGEGTGLGLPTARRIAELHGGGLELLESAPGRTVFRVRLRLAPAAALGGGVL
jgi:signal transduction histidine kinase